MTDDCCALTVVLSGIIRPVLLVKYNSQRTTVICHLTLKKTTLKTESPSAEAAPASRTTTRASDGSPKPRRDAQDRAQRPPGREPHHPRFAHNELRRLHDRPC